MMEYDLKKFASNLSLPGIGFLQDILTHINSRVRTTDDQFEFCCDARTMDEAKKDLQRDQASM